MRPRLFTAALLACLVPVQAGAAPADAVRAGDMQQMITEIVAVYEDAGLSWNHGIDWTIGPYTTTFWFYDPNTAVIAAGAVPDADQVDDYWQTWSTVLTDGNFDPAAFFASSTEARELAHYNQYVLATHESAHAITFRYDYGHLQRHGYAVNCREYYADRLTVAILNDQAASDPDMARWRDRYLELVVAMGETIPEQYRHHIDDFAALDADCALIDVAQPTPETMQPYASAYFERYRVLLEADLPTMAEVFETHLAGPHAARYGALPYAAERSRLELVTLDERDEVELETVYREDLAEGERRSRAAAFDPDGQLWYATLTYNSQTRMAQLAFGTDPLASPATGDAGAWTYPSERLEVTSLAVVSADRFLLVLDHWDRGGTDGAEREFVSWLIAYRSNDTWLFETLADFEGMQEGAVLRSPSNRIYFLGTMDPYSRESSQSWRGIEVSLETGTVVGEMAIPSSLRQPLAIDEAGRVYEELSYLLWRSAPDGTDDIVIGNGLGGPRDGIGATAELADIQVMQWMPDGKALLIDRGVGWDGWLLRELRAAQ